MTDTNPDTVADKWQSNYNNMTDKPEIVTINKIGNQYQLPKLKLTEVTNSNIYPYSRLFIASQPNKMFFITGESMDCMYNRSTITMLEVNQIIPAL